MAKNNGLKFILAFITGCLILFFSIHYSQSMLRTAPFLVSLFIMILQSKANRFGYLMGAINALFYGYVYFRVGIYASAASAVFFSFPVQLVTFINWQRHSYEKSVVFRKMSAKLRAGTAVLFVLAWTGVFTAVHLAKSSFAVLDTTATLLGILVSLLTALAYIEYSYLWLLSCGISLILSLQITLDDPANTMFLVSSVYNLYSVVCAFINVRKLYRQQCEEDASELNVNKIGESAQKLP